MWIPGYRDPKCRRDSACVVNVTAIDAYANRPAKGVTYTVHILDRGELDRQMVKSNFATVNIADIQLTIPAGRGQLTTVEGIIRDTVRDLNISQPVRKVVDPPTYEKIDEILRKLRDILNIEEGEEDEDGGVGHNDDEDEEKKHSGNPEDGTVRANKPFVPFSITLDDPSGNSFFQFKESHSDPQWNMRAYNRTFDQNVTLGLVARPDDMPEDQKAGQAIVDSSHKLGSMEEFEKRSKAQSNDDVGARGVVPEEIYSFPSTCSSCGHDLETLMQQVNIPYFQVS
jgi:zinc finger protein